MTEERKYFNRYRSNYEYKLEYGCVNCGQEAHHLHHIIPLALGGSNNDSNIVALCEECHSKIHGVNYNKEAMRRGIERAKAEGKYKGRKEVDIDNFDYHYNRYKNREINKVNLCKELDISRPTLDKLIKEYEESID